MVSFLRKRLFYGWVVVVASLIVGTTILGTHFSFGVFFKSLQAEFDLSRATTSLVFSIYMVIYGLVGILGGWALDKYGPRIVICLMGIFTGLSLLLTSQTSSPWQLFISYSLLLSIGTGATMVVLSATVSRWFDKKRGLALGITVSCGGVGIVVMSPFATYLISNLGWRTSYIVIGLIAWLVVISLSLLFKSDPSQIGALPDGIAPDMSKTRVKEETNQPVGFSLLQALRTRSFWFLGFFWLLWSLCLHLVLTHVVPYATDTGISAMEAAGVLSLLGSTSIAGKLIGGAFSDRLGRKTTAIICTLFTAGTMIWLIWSQDLWMFYLFSVVFGFAYGGIAASTLALIGDIFGLRSIGIILGAVNVGFALGAAIGPAVGGFIFDVTSSYSLAFFIGIITMLVAALLMAFIRAERHN